jgi:hypothetical protein
LARAARLVLAWYDEERGTKPVYSPGVISDENEPEGMNEVECPIITMEGRSNTVVQRNLA